MKHIFILTLFISACASQPTPLHVNEKSIAVIRLAPDSEIELKLVPDVPHRLFKKALSYDLLLWSDKPKGVFVQYKNGSQIVQIKDQIVKVEIK